MKYLITDDPMGECREVESGNAPGAVRVFAGLAESVSDCDLFFVRTRSETTWQVFSLSGGVCVTHGRIRAGVVDAADRHRYAEALRLHTDPNASVAMREHAAVTVRELLRVLNRS